MTPQIHDDMPTPDSSSETQRPKDDPIGGGKVPLYTPDITPSRAAIGNALTRFPDPPQYAAQVEALKPKNNPFAIGGAIAQSRIPLQNRKPSTQPEKPAEPAETVDTGAMSAKRFFDQIKPGKSMWVHQGGPADDWMELIYLGYETGGQEGGDAIDIHFAVADNDSDTTDFDELPKITLLSTAAHFSLNKPT